MKEIFIMHAEVCKTLANPKRLEILYCLKSGEKSAGALVRQLNIRKANLSQHLAILKTAGVIKSRRSGVNIYYKISNAKIIRACMLMRDVLKEQLKERQKLLRQGGKIWKK